MLAKWIGVGWKQSGSWDLFSLTQTGGSAVRIIQELRPIRVFFFLPPLPLQPVGVALVSGAPDGAGFETLQLVQFLHFLIQ